MCGIISKGDENGIAWRVCARKGSIAVDGRHDQIAYRGGLDDSIRFDVVLLL